ncbi:MAG TPA: type VI secretion system baseplate subunit TssG [Gemmatimonadaceae bacterium]|nr:type VI secretion system baseplate subunit TssG [Gemmatimonadaceae bacterium]
MATESGIDRPPVTLAPPAYSEVEALLETEPWAFDFFEAVRLLERRRPDRAPVGGFVDPADEVVHFGATPSIAFPASEIQSLETAGDAPAQMAVNFMGLIGPLGVLPLAYTVLAADRVRARDTALRDFLDLFNHRAISLFYRAWARSRPAATYDGTGRDGLTGHLMDLIGFGTLGLRGRLPVDDEALVYYAGLLGRQTHSAVALEQLLADYFDVPVVIEQFVGAWYPLSRPAQCALGERADASGQLGLGAVAGDEIWDQQSRVRVRLGPLRRQQYDEFLPGGSAHGALRTLTHLFGSDQIEFEITLILARDDVPPVRLGADDAEPLPLGWCTWIRTAPLARDPDETTFTL